jgi:DNA-binding PadR family transcriptional regulator
MPPVFAHGRLRLYLLKLLDEAPRHGYEVIRLLEERFQGMYVPSAGTVYPRLAKLQAEGLVTHTTEGGRKVYAITDAGRAELSHRGGELADLELEIHETVAELVSEIRADVRGAAGDPHRGTRAAASESGKSARTGAGEQGPLGEFGGSTGKQARRPAKQEMRRVEYEWKGQARRAKNESRRAREETQQARRPPEQAREQACTQAQEEFQCMARRIQQQVRDHFLRGDWPTGVREGLAELAKEFGEDSGRDLAFGHSATATGPAAASQKGTPSPEYSATPEDFPAGYEPSWAHEALTANPARDLDRLLDRFRDEIRDAARDHGVSETQLRDARRHLSAAAARIGALLRAPRG